MSNIKTILDEIAAEPGTNAKLEILGKYKDNDVLKHVLYNGMSPRIKFYIKQIPEYTPNNSNMQIEWALENLMDISSREVTGNDAINHLSYILSSINSDDAYVIERIISKDMKIGMGTTQVSKVWKGLIEKTNYMGASSYKEKLVKNIMSSGSALSELKMDGRYMNGILRGELEAESRAGEPTILTGAKFMDELATLGDQIVFNGELTIDGISKKYVGPAIRTVSNGIVASLIDISSKREERGEVETAKKIKKFEEKHGSDYEVGTITFQDALDSIIYTCWDVVSVDEFYDGKSDVPREERLMRLKSILDEHKPTGIRLIEYKYVTTVAEAFADFKDKMDRGLEGTILKSLDGGWKNGKPSFAVKLKLELAVELVVTDLNYGTKGTKNEHVVSSFTAESSCGKLKTRPQGLTEALMRDVTDNPDKYLGKIIEVGCSGVSKPKDGSLYALMYPKYLDLRSSDKSVADSLETILEIEEAAINLATK